MNKIGKIDIIKYTKLLTLKFLITINYIYILKILNKSLKFPILLLILE